MIKVKKHYGVSLLNFLLFCLLFLLHYSGILTIRALHATPVLLLPCLVAFSMFCEEITATFAGFAAGIFMDSVSSGSSCFHTVVFLLIALFVSFTVHFLFNNNIRSAILLSLLATLIYYLLRWLIFYTLGGNVTDSLRYLLQFALPSVIYTNLFIVPFYYLQRKFSRIRTNSVS